eukprot:Protomagalhaensia_wolfi_Nauph_80__3775@NODE_381_length_2637_cov_25_104696_g287_i0_p1_GENE_NODE_381_length_2637_cov_25_104696_g287_i0NODE_381_length_2637_cov_25_104696_g287_i0_p1_ORF_typecomplete_len334_score26_05TMEM208_SND2/PF05620_11/0_17TMEM208_SND2/PF05620_11/2_9e02ProkRING_1/PF14446_6/0_013ProkRING_1/PF14446_6/6_4e02RINGv/PF12906_7/0_78RINGv/PF12906_7/58FANCL_C/PF11793_8/0_15FANCL_C/PF11793_8/1_1e03PHD/PF00628_29/0_54PHD/PF00628_29/1e03DUF2180/PF09947_9/4_1zfRING_2/PF13639_6/0_46zfRING_2/PF
MESLDNPIGDHGGSYQVSYDIPAEQVLTVSPPPPSSQQPEPAGQSIASKVLKGIFGSEKKYAKDETLLRYPPRDPLCETPPSEEGGLTGSCFICLEDGQRRPLLACCSQCSAVTHQKCWYRWRRRQRLATLRARLLATNINDPLCCTICKTGVAQIQGEEGQLAWAAGDPVQQRLQDRLLSVLGRMLQAARGDDEESVSLPQPALQRITLIAAVVLIISIAVDVLLFAFSEIKYWGLIVIPTFALLYLVGCLSCIAISIYQRQLALGPLRQRPTPPRTPRLTPRLLEESAHQLPLEALATQGRSSYCHDVCLELWDTATGKIDVVMFSKGNAS